MYSVRENLQTLVNPISMSLTPRHATQCLKEQGRNSVWLLELPNGSIQVLKQWSLTPWLAVKLLLGISQPQRQCRGTRRLKRAGVPTSNMPRLGLSRCGLIPQLTLTVSYIEGTPCLELLQQNAIDDDKAIHIGRQLGQAVRRIADAGFFNRDIKLSNVIIGLGQRPEVFIIDPVGLRRSRDKVKERDRMIERLGCELVGQSIKVPRAGWLGLLLAALKEEPPMFRRAVIGRLRARRRS